MPSGFRLDTDSWVKEYDACKELAQEIVTLIQERNTNHPDGGPEASRATAAARRKLGTLGTSVDALFRWLDSPDAAAMSEQERFRRRDLLHALKSRREQAQQSLKRQPAGAEREQLLAGAGAGAGASAATGPSGSGGAGRETAATAALDARGLLQLQEHVMRQQDTELEQMEKSVHSTKHIAVAIGEELDLHTRLLGDLQDDVDVTHSRLRAATKRVKYVIQHSGNWRFGLFIFGLIVVLTLAVLVALKIIRIFG